MAKYSGVDNLEAMKDATNYNSFLLNTLQAHSLPGDKILDFGAGAGTFTLPLAKVHGDISAVEADPQLLQRIVNQGIQGYAALELVPNGHFDYIFTLNVLEHIEDDAEALRQIARKLGLGGRLLIYVPAFQLLFSSMDRKVGHFRRYRRQPLRLMLTRCGFSVVELRYVDSLGFLATLLYKFFGRDDGGLNRGSLLVFDRIVFPLSRCLDKVTGRLFGKNLLAVAIRQGPLEILPASRRNQ